MRYAVALLILGGCAGGIGSPDASGPDPRQPRQEGARDAAAPPPPAWPGEWYEPGLGPRVAELFLRPAGDTDAPMALYPLDGATFPPNWPLGLQWRRGHAKRTVARHRFYGDSGMFDAYMLCRADGCKLNLPPAVWAAISDANRGRQIRWEVSEAGAEHPEIATSPPVALGVYAEPISGRAWWFEGATNDKPFRWRGGIMTANLLTGETAPYIAPHKNADASGCVGCHSRGGCNVAYTQSFGLSGMTMVDAADIYKVKLVGDGGTFMSLSPSGKHIAIVSSGDLDIYDTKYGHRKAGLNGRHGGGLPPGHRADHPAWSPGGEKIAFMLRPPGGLPSDGFGIRGSIATIDWMPGAPSDQIAPPLGNLRVVVAATDAESGAYPTWTPDSKRIVYMAFPTGRRLNNTDLTRLAVCSAAGGTPTYLEHADSALGPKWPSVMDTNLGPMVAFYSRRDFGLEAGRSYWDGGKGRLWLVPLDGGPPIWFPFQGRLPTWLEDAGWAVPVATNLIYSRNPNECEPCAASATAECK